MPLLETSKRQERDKTIVSRHVIVRVLEAWPNDQLCPDFHQLWPDLWPKVARSMAK